MIWSASWDFNVGQTAAGPILDDPCSQHTVGILEVAEQLLKRQFEAEIFDGFSYWGSEWQEEKRHMATALDSLKCRFVATSPSLGPNSLQLSNLPTLLPELSPSTSEFALINPSASAQYENSTYSPHQLPATPPLAEDFPLLPKAIQHQSRSPNALPPKKTAKLCHSCWSWTNRDVGQNQRNGTIECVAKTWHLSLTCHLHFQWVVFGKEELLTVASRVPPAQHLIWSVSKALRLKTIALHQTSAFYLKNS